jgi:hypothetical protein
VQARVLDLAGRLGPESAHDSVVALPPGKGQTGADACHGQHQENDDDEHGPMVSEADRTSPLRSDK